MKLLKIVLPLVILSTGGLLAWQLYANRPQAKPEPAVVEPPEVEVVTVRPEWVRLSVPSQGVVTPQREITLAAEVAGKIIKVHPAFAAGGFFQQGEILVMLDTRDYDYLIIKTQAQIAEARRELLREQAEAEQARHEWQALGGGKPPTEYVLHKPHIAERQAKLAAAEAELAQARLNRDRCHVRALFAGRIHEKKVDLGQYVNVGEALARIYTTNVAEVRLPITSEQLDFLDLPLSSLPSPTRRGGSPVALTARLGGKMHRWQGRVVRTEGALDDKTGTFYAVVQVNEPYARRAERPPLAVGLFVQAEILGRERGDVIALPLTALLRGTPQVLVVDKDQRVHFRTVEILRGERERVLINGGLEAGERIVTGGLETPIEGMKVSFKPSVVPDKIGVR